MGNEYALDWLDQMVNELDPQRTELENLDDYQSMMIVDKAAGEETRLIQSFKQLGFKKEKSRQIRDAPMEITESFDRLELIMIERNYNSPLFVKYLTSKFLDKVNDPVDPSSVVENLSFLQKTFNQIPVMKDMIFSSQFDDLSLTVNAWFIQEIDFQSKRSRTGFSEPADELQRPSKKYDRKTSDKILCNLTVDQLSLFFKAADLSNIISSRSLSAIFQSVAPYLSTPHRTDISHSSLRVKSYSVEERDKSLLIETMIRLTEQIRDL